MSTHAANDEPTRRRDLHRRIGRSRRKIDARLRAVGDHVRRLLSWRKHVARHPGWALAAAAAVGLAASGALRRHRFVRRLVVVLIRGSFGGFFRDSAGAELREAVAARRELAQLEIQADLRAVWQFAVAGLLAAMFGLAALPLAAVVVAERLDGCGEISRVGWLSIFAAGFLVFCVGIGCLAWLRFRRKFLGLPETLEELREDWTWLREKTENR